MPFRLPHLRKTFFAAALLCGAPYTAQQPAQNSLVPFAPAGAHAAEESLQIEYENRFYSWRQLAAQERGHQWTSLLTTQYRLMTDAVMFEYANRVGFIRSERSTPWRPGRAQGPTDATFNATLTFATAQGTLFPFLTASANLPIGRSTLFGREKNAIMDGDLVGHTRLGEGLNTQIGGGVTWHVDDRWSLTTAATYKFSGPYVPDGNFPFRFQSGDEIVASTDLVYEGETGRASIGFRFGTQTSSLIEEVAYFRPGDGWTVFGTVARAFGEGQQIEAQWSVTRQRRNHFFDPFTGNFEREEARSAGDILQLSLNWSQARDWGRWGLTGSVLRRTANGYDPKSDLFIPARTRWMAGPHLTLASGSGASLTARAQAMRLNEDRVFLTGQTRRFIGAQLSLSANLEF